VLGGARPQRLPAMAVSAGFFDALGVQPAVGRVPTAAEQKTPVALVSHAFWRDSLSGGALAGRKLEIEGHSFSVLGVMPAGFDYPEGAQVWVPLELFEPSPYRTAHNHKVIARLLPGAQLEQVEARLAALTRRVAHEGPDPAEASEYLPVGARVRRLQVERALPVRGALFLLLGAAGFVLLVACSNLASTFLARGLERQRELAVRRALGASRRQLVRQLVVEASVLAAAGCLAGLLLATTLGRAAVAAAPPLVASAAMRLDAPVWLYTVALAAVAALLASLAPSLVATAAPAGSLRGGRSEGISPGQRRTWGALIAVQAGLALLLLAGAGLLLRSFASLLAVTPGFEPAGVATLRVSPPVGVVGASPPQSGYPDDAAVARFQERLVGALAASPGIAAAGVISQPPFDEFDPTGQMRARSGRRADASYRVASGGYFDAVRIPLVAGRLFDPRDDASHPHAAVVDRAAAELFWPGEDPLGQQISSEGMDEFGAKPEWATVVGVVGNVRQSDLAGPPDPTVYFAMAQRPRRDAVVVARGPRRGGRAAAGDAEHARAPRTRRAGQRRPARRRGGEEPRPAAVRAAVDRHLRVADAAARRARRLRRRRLRGGAAHARAGRAARARRGAGAGTTSGAARCAGAGRYRHRRRAARGGAAHPRAARAALRGEALGPGELARGRRRARRRGAARRLAAGAACHPHRPASRVALRMTSRRRP